MRAAFASRRLCRSLGGRVADSCPGSLAAPEVLVSARIYALLCYASTSALASPDKLSAFHDQLRKVLLLYGRAAEALGYSALTIGAEVKRAFERVVGELERQGLLGGAAREDRKWRELCEVVLHIARRVRPRSSLPAPLRLDARLTSLYCSQADDLAFVSRASALLGIPSSSTSSPAAAPASPAVQSTHLCAKLANSLALFESAQRTPDAPPPDLADALRRALGALPLLTPLRLLPATADLDRAERTKIDKLVDRARYVLAKHAKRGVPRLDQLMVPADAPPGPAPSEVDELVRGVLDALAAHAEALVLAPSENGDGVVSRKERDLHALGAVDSLLILAYSSVDLSSPSPPARALALLRRARALVDLGAPGGAGPQLERGYSLRTLASAAYNIGGTLFNAGRAADALGFARQACELGERVVEKARGEGLLGERERDVLEGFAELRLGGEAAGEGGEEEKSRSDEERKGMVEAARDFERLMGRRWELLALVQHQIGDKKVRLCPSPCHQRGRASVTPTH